LPTNIDTLDLYVFGKNAIPFLPGAEVWAGRRGYLYQFYVNIIDRRSYVIGGDGGGINDIALGDFAKLDIAYLTASPTGGTQTTVNPLNPTGSTYGDVRTNNGNLNKQSIFARLHDIETPFIGGKTSLMAQYQFAAGGRALVSGDFQGVPGTSYYNNLNYAGGIRFPQADGVSVALIQDNKFDLMHGDLKVTNHLFLGAGFGTAFDTTNADKLRASPYYAVPTETLVANNNTVYTLADAHAFKEADQIDFYYKDKIELEAYAIYEYQNSGRPDVPIADAALNFGTGGTVRAKGLQNWVDVGIRPAYNFTPFFALEAEATYNYINNTAYNAIRSAAGFDSGAGNLFKFTIAPTFHYGKAGNYPLELHFYYTLAVWNDNLRGSVVGGDPNANRNIGHLFGTQAVINF
ncbi:MAG: carbohydrate porin, partial [Rhodospirillales bacterium]|nr:carbohydrate porin [Acetobacter sp.]